MTIIEQLEALQGEKLAVDGKLAEALAGIASKDDEIAALKAQIEAHATDKANIETKHAEALAAVTAERDAAITAKADAEKQIDEFRRKLEDPAYKSASISGDQQAVTDGGAVAPGADAKTLMQQMIEIRDPKERRAFYLKNEKDIKAGL